MNTHCGLVAILGAPNAGKSTLLNRLVGSKVAIVTPKAQTTRARIRGVCMEGRAQIVFVDTPGIFDATQPFEKSMVQSAWAGMRDADAVLLLIDARKGLTGEAGALVERLARSSPYGEGRKATPLYVALNKIDLVKKPDLLALATKVHDQLPSLTRLYMISAEKGSGVKDIVKDMAAALPVGPWLYPEDQLTDLSERLIAAEITREKLFLQLREELPYAIHVETESWEEHKDKSVHISQVIYVEREGQKKIILGAKGAMLKKIGIAARKELERVLARKMHLSLFVKVSEKWKTDPERFRYLGLEP